MSLSLMNAGVLGDTDTRGKWFDDDATTGFDERHGSPLRRSGPDFVIPGLTRDLFAFGRPKKAERSRVKPGMTDDIILHLPGNDADATAAPSPSPPPPATPAP
jgi:hypothetical protein